MHLLNISKITDCDADKGFLRQMTAADLSRVLAMRNHSEIRRHMLTQHEISYEEHALWFKRSSESPGLDLQVWVVEGKCYGFVQFKETNFHGVLDWGVYVASDATKGTGRKLGVAALNYAFEKKENIHKVCGQALHTNFPSIKFHKSLGFTQEGILRDQFFDGIAHQDLMYFGILKPEWVASKQLTDIQK